MALVPAARGLVVVPEFRNADGGRPDIAIVRQGAPPRAFVELKAPDKRADPTRWRDHDRRQFERLKELGCWASSNFSELRLFSRGEERAVASVVPERALRPDRDDGRANREIEEHDAGPLLQIVELLTQGAGQAPIARDAPHLAGMLAHSARLVRGIVEDRLAEHRAGANPRHALLQVRQEFRDVLYAIPKPAATPRNTSTLSSRLPLRRLLPLACSLFAKLRAVRSLTTLGGICLRSIP